MTTREIEDDAWRVRLDTTGQVLGVEVPTFVSGESPGGRADELLPTLPGPGDGPVSAATLLLKAKQFDDGLMAAVELAAQKGIGRFPGKAGVLQGVAEALGHDPAAIPLLAACRLGRVPVSVPPSLDRAVARATARFLAADLRSKPLGFYTWRPELEDVFRQDRFLQETLAPAVADTVAATLDRVPDGWSGYDAVLALAARLTNPAMGPSLRGAGGRRAFLPASRSPEVTLFDRLVGDRPVPAGFDLMTELIRRVHTGQIDLTPAVESGWYDHQAWSLDPLVRPDAVPEAARLDLGPRYRQHLEDLFRGALALARETHVKQAGGGYGGGGRRVRPVYVRPGLSAEPVPTVYARRAAGYRFVRGVLDESCGDGWRTLRRLTSRGPVEDRLGDELDRMEGLFGGAAATSYRDLGLNPPTESGEAAATFVAWRAGLRADPDVARDARMMVPVYYDLGRRRTKVWAFLGWRMVRADVDYRTPPAVLSIEPARPPGVNPNGRREAGPFPGSQTAEPPPVRFAGDRYEFPEPVMAEVYVTRLHNRDEFRRHCDRHRTRAAILRALG